MWVEAPADFMCLGVGEDEVGVGVGGFGEVLLVELWDAVKTVDRF